MRITMVDRTHAQVCEAPNITLAFAADEDATLVDRVLGMLVHSALAEEDGG